MSDTNNNPSIICVLSHCCHTLLVREHREGESNWWGELVCVFVNDTRQNHGVGDR